MIDCHTTTYGARLDFVLKPDIYYIDSLIHILRGSLGRYV